MRRGRKAASCEEMLELLEAAVYATALQESESRSAWSLHRASAPGGELTSTLLSKNALQTEGEELTERLIRSHNPLKPIWLFFLENQSMEIFSRAAICSLVLTDSNRSIVL